MSSGEDDNRATTRSTRMILQGPPGVINGRPDTASHWSGDGPWLPERVPKWAYTQSSWVARLRDDHWLTTVYSKVVQTFGTRARAFRLDNGHPLRWGTGCNPHAH